MPLFLQCGVEGETEMGTAGCEAETCPDTVGGTGEYTRLPDAWR